MSPATFRRIKRVQKGSFALFRLIEMTKYKKGHPRQFKLAVLCGFVFLVLVHYAHGAMNQADRVTRTFDQIPPCGALVTRVTSKDGSGVNGLPLLCSTSISHR